MVVFGDGRRGVNPLAGFVIILVVVTIIALAFAGFGSEIISYYTGYVEKLRPVSALKVYANQFEIKVRNEGSVEERIDAVFVSGHRAYVYYARRLNGSSALIRGDEGRLVVIRPGETVIIRGFVPKVLVPDVVYEVKFHTITGYEFYYPVKAVKAPFETGIVGFNTGIKDPRDPSRRIVLFAPVIENIERTTIEVTRIEIYNSTSFESPVFTYVPPTLITVQPGEVYKPSSWREMIKVGLRPGTYYVRVDYRVGGSEDYLLSTAVVENRTLKAYVLYITVDDEGDPVIREPYPGWSVDIQRMIERVRRLADVRVIGSMSEYKSLILEGRGIEEPCIIINIHSEPVPLPLSYIDEGSKRVRWHEWFRKISSFISGHRVVWVNPSGYPFWGIANKRMARKYGYPTWTSNWGRMINERSLGSAYRDTGGATNLDGTSFQSAYNGEYGWGCCSSCPARGVTYNGFPVVTGGKGLYCARTWNYPITCTSLVEEFNEFFGDFGISLPEHTTGWDVPKVSSASKVYYETSSDVPIVYALKLGDGYLLVVGLPPGYTDLSVDMSIYLAVHIVLFEYELPSYQLP